MQHSECEHDNILHCLELEFLQLDGLIQMCSILLSLMEARLQLDSTTSTSLGTERFRSINDFPDEILLNILSYFGPEDLCTRIAKVCERWNDLSKDVTLWKTLTYRCDNESNLTSVVQVLTEAPMLKSFVIFNRKDAAQLLEFMFDSCDGIKKLILSFCGLGEDSTGLLANIVTFYPDLEELSLEGCTPLTYAGYSLIPQLSLDDVTQIFDEDVMHIIKKVGSQLTTLVLDGEELTDSSFCSLHLCSRSGSKDLTGKSIKGIVDKCHNLKELSLDDVTQIFDEDVMHIIKKVGSQLTTLVLDGEELTDSSYCSLHLCSSCLHLKSLSLCWCWDLTDAGILQVISHCSKLQYLNLLGVVHITGTGYFALVPTHLPQLQRLNLEQCNNISDESLASLVAAVPNLVVINYYGEEVTLVKEEESAHELDSDWALGDEVP
ncbi:hypothetical protein C0J52_08781 [Blattella germanica]|nr:hypothetical protein C0J52_08781 [Blattella germanica]